VAAEGEDASVVTFEQDGERLLAPDTHTADELLDRGQLE
jgi:hypothetical protein